MAGERRGFEVGGVLHALVFQLSVADVSFLPLAELGDKPKLHDDGLGDFALQERRAHWMTEPYLSATPHRVWWGAQRADSRGVVESVAGSADVWGGAPGSDNPVAAPQTDAAAALSTP